MLLYGECFKKKSNQASISAVAMCLYIRLTWLDFGVNINSRYGSQQQASPVAPTLAQRSVGRKKWFVGF